MAMQVEVSYAMVFQTDISQQKNTMKTLHPVHMIHMIQLPIAEFILLKVFQHGQMITWHCMVV